MLYKYIEEHANSTPNKVALIDGSISLSYNNLYRKMNEFGLLIKDEINHIQLVGILLPNGLDAILSLLSIPLSGNIAVPIDATVKQRNFDLIVEDNDINHIITSKKYEHLIASHPRLKIIYVEEHRFFQFDLTQMAMVDETVPYQNIQGNETSYIYFTTGTTGIPKGVMLTHNNLCHSASNIIEYMNINDTLIESIPMPLSHSFGFARLRVGLQVGGTIIIEKGLLFIKKLLDNIIRHKVNALSMVPAAYELMLTKYLPLFEQFAFSLKFIELGSASIKNKFKQQLIELCPNATICMHFGSTEASRSIYINFKEDLNFLNSIGKASPNVEIHLLDETGSKIETPDVPGELVINSNNLAKGYWKDTALTDRKFRSDGFRTGDYAKYDKYGYLYYIGKKEDILNIDGFMVSPKEIESVISKYPSITDIAVTAHSTDSDNDDEIIAYIVTDTEIDTDHLRIFCNKHLESHKIPDSFIFIDNIPKTWSGKIEKFKLQAIT